MSAAAATDGTAIPANVFTGFLAYKHNKLEHRSTRRCNKANKYGSPTEVVGLDPTTCGLNQNDAGVVAGSKLRRLPKLQRHGRNSEP